MHKRPLQDVVWCGIDVSATQLVVAVLGDACTQQRNFENRAAGHRALVAWLQRQAGTTQVCLEATGIYSLDLALALHAADRIAVSVLNPKIVCRFAETLRRSKTDTADAQVLAEYARRMPFLAWCPPTATALRLRAITRHLAALVKQHTAVSNQLHAAQASVLMPACVRQDLRRSLRSLERSRQRMRREGMELVQHDSELARRFTLLQTVPGIGEASALYLLAELLLLPAGLSVRQWVAHSGLDPKHHQSGSSVQKASRISRNGNHHLRQALYMPALVAVRHDPYLRAFYDALQQRHKRKMQALVAVSRKILHAIYGMFRSDCAYDGSRLFSNALVIAT
jgi:transposase